MYRKIVLIILVLSLFSCTRRAHPTRSAEIIYNAEKPIPKSEDKPAGVKPATTTVKPKAEFPDVIFVNDAAARKSVDGRLYYDVKGHRYWKNYKDGKYYLFNKSMYANPDFKPPAGDKR